MVRRKPSAPPPKRLVWRISEAAPLGEFVDPDAPVRLQVTVPERENSSGASSGGGWAMSSFELLHGADVSEGPDTVPNDLFDELFKPVRTDPKPPPR